MEIQNLGNSLWIWMTNNLIFVQIDLIRLKSNGCLPHKALTYLEMCKNIPFSALNNIAIHTGYCILYQYVDCKKKPQIYVSLDIVQPCFFLGLCESSLRL